MGPAGLGTVQCIGSESVEFIVGQILREAASGPRGGRWGGGTGGSVNPGSPRLWVNGLHEDPSGLGTPSWLRTWVSGEHGPTPIPRGALVSFGASTTAMWGSVLPFEVLFAAAQT